MLWLLGFNNTITYVVTEAYRLAFRDTGSSPKNARELGQSRVGGGGVKADETVLGGRESLLGRFLKNRKPLGVVGRQIGEQKIFEGLLKRLLVGVGYYEKNIGMMVENLKLEDAVEEVWGLEILERLIWADLVTNFVDKKIKCTYDKLSNLEKDFQSPK